MFVRSTCSDINKDRIVREMLDNDFVKVVKEYMQLLLNTDDWNDKPVTVAIVNMVKALGVLSNSIRRRVPEIVCQIYDQYFDVICNHLNHPLMIKVANGPVKAPAFRIIISLLRSLQCFTRYASTICESRMTESVTTDLKQLLEKYVQLVGGDDESTTLCLGALNYLEKDDCPFAPLPVKYMETLRPSDENVEQFATDVEYVVKRLSSLSMEDHIARPLKYQIEFR